MIDDTDRMLFCDVCGADACFGFGVTVDGIRMGDVGSWRCAEHHPDRPARLTLEQWAEINKVDLPADQHMEAAE